MPAWTWLDLICSDPGRLSQLLGSDYTDGVHGVGIVNAMETISAFGASHTDLGRFAKWVRAWRDADDAKITECDESDDEADEERQQKCKKFKTRHRTVRRNWVLPEGFPSEAVSTAYLNPQVNPHCSAMASSYLAIQSICRASSCLHSPRLA